MVQIVSIIVVTYNSADYIEGLVRSIYEFNKNKYFELIIVDNASEDGTVQNILRLKSYNLKLIQNKENVGFAKGINIGVREARGEYLLFINPDALWKNGSVDDFASIFESDPNIGVIGGKILAKDGKAEKSAGKFLKTFEVFLTALSLDEALGVRFSPNRRVEADFVSGGFMAVRKNLFEKLGGFDENLFMYVEDMEFCYRAKKEGFKVIFDPSAAIIHESHGSSGRKFAIENIHKGLIYFHKKHGSIISYNLVKFLLGSKSFALVLLGKIINNKEALRS
jgi:GT2 family glycosyltransferase